MIVAAKPQEIINILTNVYNFKLKGTGQISFHLGMDFFHDEEGALCFAPKKYTQKMQDTYVQMFGTKPNTNMMSPLELNDHPELDES